MATADAMTFLGIVLVLTVTPGADMALLMRHVLAHGFRATWPTLAGIETGLAVHIILCITGLSLTLQQSPLAFTIIKLAGAGWLAWLGLTAVLAALRPASSAADALDAAVASAEGDEGLPRHQPAAPSWRRLYARGLLTNLLNVKILLFYIALLPQFAPAGESFIPVAIVLASVQLLIGLIWLISYGALVARAGQALERNPRLRRWLEGATGAALVAFGTRLAAVAR